MKKNSIKSECRNNKKMNLKGAKMENLFKKTFAAVTFFSMMTLGFMLAGCGGGGSGEVSSKVVSGTADVGAPLSGQVSLKDSSTPYQQKSTVIGSDGSYAIDVTGMKAPYVLQATGNADGVDYKLLSFAEGAGTANINPLSDAIVTCAANDGNSAAAGSNIVNKSDSDKNDEDDAYEKSDSDKNHKIKNNLTRTVAVLLNKLEPLLKRYSAEHSNPITTRYIVKRLDLDDMYKKIKITVADGTLFIINRKSGAIIFSGKISDIANGIFDGGSLPPVAEAPLTPTGLTAVGGTGKATLTWTSVSNATSYNVYYATASGVTPTSGTKITTVSSPFIHNGLTAGTTYYYVVSAVNSTGESAATAEVSAGTTSTPPPPALPSAPAGVIATGGTNQVTLSWGAVNSATTYNIYYATTSGVTKANGTKISNATTTAVHSGLTAGTTYYYIVAAVNGAGEGAASIQFSAKTLDTIPSPTVPVTPTGVTSAGGSNLATISWPAVSGAASYNVYWSTTNGVTISNGTKVAGVSSPYTRTGLSAGTTYYFIVTAVNSVGESAASTQTAATTAAAVPAVPAAPTGVTATGDTTSQVTISWAAVSGATSYNIYWATTSGVTTGGSKITVANNSYVQTGLAASTTYYYIVTAVNAAGQSAASTQVSAPTKAPVVTIPAAPAGVTATGGASQASISWSAVSGATSYNIYYATTSGVTKTNGLKVTNATAPYTQNGLVAGTTYYFIVTAVNSAGEGAASAQASAATNPVVTPPAVCVACHAVPPTTGAHTFHVSGENIGCATCHGAGYSSNTVNAATHANGTVNIATGTPPGWNGSSCSNSCHGSKSW